jgi:hypothetical protein
MRIPDKAHVIGFDQNDQSPRINILAIIDQPGKGVMFKSGATLIYPASRINRAGGSDTRLPSGFILVQIPKTARGHAGRPQGLGAAARRNRSLMARPRPVSGIGAKAIFAPLPSAARRM